MKRHAWVAAHLVVVSALAYFAPGCGGDDTGTTGTGGSAGGGTGGATGTGGTGGSNTGGSATGGSNGTGGAGTGGGSTGGATGTGGAADAGRDVSTGTGGGGATDGSATDAAEAAVILACNPVPADNSACNGNAPCTVACGVNISALTTTKPSRTCTCRAGAGDGGARDGGDAGGSRWSCPTGPGSCIYPTAEANLNCLVVPNPLPACPHDPADAGTVPDSGTGLIRTGVSPCEVPSSETCGAMCGSASPTVFSYQTSGGTPTSGYCVCVGGIYQCATVNEWFTP